MKKKEYTSPELLIVRVNTEIMISSSVASITGADGLGVGGETLINDIAFGNVKGFTNVLSEDAWGE